MKQKEFNKLGQTIISKTLPNCRVNFIKVLINICPREYQIRAGAFYKDGNRLGKRKRTYILERYIDNEMKFLKS